MPNTSASRYAYSSPYDGKHSNGGHKKHRRWLTVLLIILAVLLVVVITLAICAYFLMGSVQRVRTQASDLTSSAQTLVTAIQDGDKNDLGNALTTASQNMGSDIEAIQAEISTPLWNVAAHLPVVGTDVSAARDLVDTAADLVNDVLSPAANTTTNYPLTIIVANGAVNSEALQAYCSLAQQITPTVQSCANRLASIEAPHVSQINDAVEKVSEPLQKASNALTTYEPLFATLPAMFGCNGARSYVITAQNPVELHSTGGFPGSLALMTMQDGAFSLGDFFSCNDFVSDYNNSLPVTDEERNLFGPDQGVYYGNTNFNYDFPRTADLWSQFWQRDRGVTPDGIIALDPVVLQYLIGAIGNVTMPDGVVLTGDNTATILLHDVYWNFTDYNAMDEYFATAAFNTLNTLISEGSGVDLTGLIDAIQRGIDEGRIKVWMRDSTEENAITALGCDGAVGNDPANPELGVYFSDNTGSKYDWYLSTNTVVGDAVQNTDGTTSYAVTTTYTNNATQDDIALAQQQGDSKAHYIFGENADALYLGDMMTTIYLSAPAGGTITNYAMSNGDGLYDMPYNGHQTLHVMSHMAPQETITVTYTVTTAAGAAPLTVDTTPTIWSAVH